MRILTISARYPTLLQTWFINYLQSMENTGESIQVISLFKGTNDYNPKIDQLKPIPVWTAKVGRLTSFFKALKFVILNSFNRRLYTYLRSIVRTSDSLKGFLNALLLSPAVNFKPDIIHCHSEKAAHQLLPILKFYDKPIVLTFHGLTPDGVKEITKLQRDKLYSHLSLVLANTKFAAKQCQSLVDSDVNIKIIPQGIDLDEFPYTPQLLKERQEPINVLTVGRIDKLKGHLYAIDGIISLRDTGIKIQYHIVGAGLYESELEKYIEKRKASDFIKLCGVMTGKNLKKLYQESHIFILPSYQEGDSWAETQGIVLQEAQACGKIVIASDSGGIPECISDGKTGFLVKQKSAESIANALAYVLDNSSSWEQWQLNARKDVEERFSLDAMGEQLLIAYRSLVSDNT